MRAISPLHLARRWWGTIRAKPLTTEESTWVRSHLLSAEWSLWVEMDWRDQRHSYHVARRFVTPRPGEETPSRPAVAAALLHDVGKTLSDLTTFERVIATVVGGRTERFRSYVDHEDLGIEMCRGAGSDPQTLALLSGDGDEALLRRLRTADEV